uniref:Arrestin C-terminal-like domain-containing protein n=1 Tax=Myripristis murdjan TaxID=586833 RepID=A0A667ZAH6_9TELE
MTVKQLLLEYDKVNERGTLSPGDTLSGRVTVVTDKETKVQCFLVKAKGKAEVMWPEQDRGASLVHSDKKTYFYFEDIILQDKKGDGLYRQFFLCQEIDMPSSYKGKWGKIIYSLRAKLTQSIWQVHKAKTEFDSLTAVLCTCQEPQYGTRISFYGSGKVTMNVSSEKMGLKQGETMEVSAEVLNNSAHTVTPKFFLCEKQTFVAQSQRIVHTNAILLGTGESVSAATSRTVSTVLTVPSHLPPTFFNCSKMKLEYRLKVTLDVPLGRDLEIKLPLVILLGQPKPPKEKAKRSWFT